MTREKAIVTVTFTHLNGCIPEEKDVTFDVRPIRGSRGYLVRYMTRDEHSPTGWWSSCRHVIVTADTPEDAVLASMLEREFFEEAMNA